MASASQDRYVSVLKLGPANRFRKKDFIDSIGFGIAVLTITQFFVGGYLAATTLEKNAGFDSAWRCALEALDKG
jgi:hypothetical protein